MRTTIQTLRPSSRDWPAFWSVLLLAMLAMTRGGFAFQDPPEEKPPAKGSPPAQFVNVGSPVDGKVFDQVRDAALKLQAEALRAGRTGVLVLEINPGRSSELHHVYGLSKFLIEQVRDLKTVAWVSRPIPGNHTMLALACDEIVLGGEAALGDIGLRRDEDASERDFLLKLAKDGHNQKINAALVAGMLDPELKLKWIKTDKGHDVVTEEELDRLLQQGQKIEKPALLKDAGVPGLFTAEQARDYEILAEHVLPKDAERLDVAEKYQLAREAMREPQPTARDRKAIIVRVDEIIDPVAEQFVKRQVERAVASGAELLIFEIDSPEGGLYECMSLADAVLELSQRKVRTVAFVPKRALGGAAMIALACDEVYLTPQAELGEIRPALNATWGPDADKLKNALDIKLTDLAKQKGRPAALLRAMADEKLVVYSATNKETGQVSFLTEDELRANDAWVKGDVVPETDRKELLKIDGNRANVLRLAETPVEDLNDLKRRVGLANSDVPVAQRTWVDTLVFELNKEYVTASLIVLALLFAYLEMHFGIGLFGISSGLCFTLFFWSRFLGGTAGWLEVLLFLMGIACLALELFVVPGFGAFGVSGVLLVLFSLILASQTFIIPASQSELVSFTRNFGTLAGSLVGVIVLGVLISRYLPHMPFFEGMVLTPPGADAAANEPKLNPAWVDPALVGGTLLARDASLVGRQGLSMTLLRPAGKARFGEELVDVISEGTLIPAGRTIEVVSVEGTVVVVREASA